MSYGIQHRIQRPAKGAQPLPSDFSQFKVRLNPSTDTYEVWTFTDSAKMDQKKWIIVSKQDAEWYLKTGAIFVAYEPPVEADFNMHALQELYRAEAADTAEIQSKKIALKTLIHAYMYMENNSREELHECVTQISILQLELQALKEKTRKPLEIVQFEQEMRDFDDSNISPLL